MTINRQAQAYKQKENGKGGRFAKLNPCYGCGKSAGENYFSHGLTDTGEWADLALVLCERCATATESMTNPLDFVAYAEKKGGISAEDAARARAIAKAEGA